MKKILVSAATVAALAVAGAFVTIAPAERAEARKVMQTGAINSGQIRFCENQRGEKWRTAHAPGKDDYFHQEIVLGEGSYSIAMVPDGNFRFNAFVYEGEGRKYVGGARNVRSYLHRFNPGSFGEKYLVQLVKTTNTCRGCSVTMSLNARNCPEKSRSTRRKPCRVNQCYDPGSQGIFGIPNRPPRCIARPGADGGMC